MMNTNSVFKFFLLSVCASLVLSACASPDDELERCGVDPGLFSDCFQPRVKELTEWTETATLFPPLPRAENLRRIDAFTASNAYEYLVDRASIVRGDDGVMRYTVVIRSSTGKSNVFHEGIRCETTEVRTYGYASSSGGFRRAVQVPWKRAARSGLRGYQNYLANEIMCDSNGWAWDASKASAALDAQFTSGGVRIKN